MVQRAVRGRSIALEMGTSCDDMLSSVVKREGLEKAMRGEERGGKEGGKAKMKEAEGEGTTPPLWMKMGSTTRCLLLWFPQEDAQERKRNVQRNLAERDAKRRERWLKGAALWATAAAVGAAQ